MYRFTVQSSYNVIKAFFLSLLSILLIPFYTLLLIGYWIKWRFLNRNYEPRSRKELAAEYHKLSGKVYAAIDREMRNFAPQATTPPPRVKKDGTTTN